ncbi:DUF1642 domain-containing protein [Enterococcus avium]|uniref:DUF1642 domain-containing protein n=1 Tax=Enterococcus avium TaxID=33945 RepID=UPI0032E4639E
MKQELLKWIYENKVGLGTVETVYMDDLIEMINELEEPQVTNEQAWNKIAETYPETAQNLRITLDHAVYGHEAEPQKVKVPKFVGPFIEKLKNTNRRYGVELEKAYNNGQDEELVNWLWFNENVRVLFKALENGYEVEEEPKWKIINDQKYCLTSIEAGYGNSLHWAFDSTKKKPILFDNEETALYTAYITGGKVEKV